MLQALLFCSTPRMNNAFARIIFVKLSPNRHFLRQLNLGPEFANMVLYSGRVPECELC